MDRTLRTPLVAGNWKMNGLKASLAEAQTVAANAPASGVETLLCPPAILIAAAAALPAPLNIGAQDCHAAASGAHTGDLSAEMVADAGGVAVIVGHSERRANHGETDADVQAKAEAALRAGLVAIVCIGETEADRDAGRTLEVLGAQIDGSLPTGASADNTVLAYEPVWAIGTGKTPTLSDIAEAHAFIRARVAERTNADNAAAMRVLYGGSVKPGNAAEIFAIADVDGGLIGGASLKASDFLAIVAAATGGDA